MATLTIRNLPEATRSALKARAAVHNHSMEAEVRDILQSAVSVNSDFVSDWIAEASSLRGDFEVPARSSAREVRLA